ncbi:helix-turn-helix domain-containing protein [Tessaracoccus massiliensis]|uniref:helix-turn-helix domain-containing protein n=1 Tax=Tessaracoccus massiliensis TaxID=1522311 RepID=UPI00058C061D|nr:helix-turn-helix domain-containing protein [Tessaracoccus massiliensis]
MPTTLHANGVKNSELELTVEFARTLPSGSPIAVMLQYVVEAMDRGRDITFLEQGSELSPAEAAELLKVSRPHLLKLMDRGLLEFRRVGTHRRIAMADLLDYIDRHERANAHVHELLGTREHGLKAVQDRAAALTETDLEELEVLNG